MGHTHSLYVTPTGDIDGSNKTFTLPVTPVTDSTRVFINGLEQYKTTDFSVSGVTLTMVGAPKTDDDLKVHYQVAV